MNTITPSMIEDFKQHLITEEKSPLTVQKYTHDAAAFAHWLSSREISKYHAMQYKEYLKHNYAAASVNSILSALNSLFTYICRQDCKVKTLNIQKHIFIENDKELTKDEYIRLLQAAKRNKRLYYIMQTICSTGIRVSELKYITVAAVNNGQASIHCKAKLRVIILPYQLCDILKEYIRERNIHSGPVFVSRSGIPLDRSNIWSEMKCLCRITGIPRTKVFPHNLRHLFARTYYSMQKDIVRLADILGHSSVNTTRIYTIESGEIHRSQLEQMNLIESRV